MAPVHGGGPPENHPPGRRVVRRPPESPGLAELAWEDLIAQRRYNWARTLFAVDVNQLRPPKNSVIGGVGLGAAALGYVRGDDGHGEEFVQRGHRFGVVVGEAAQRVDFGPTFDFVHIAYSYCP